MDRTFESICADFCRTRAFGAHSLTDEQIEDEARSILAQLEERDRRVMEIRSYHMEKHRPGSPTQRVLVLVDYSVGGSDATHTFDLADLDTHTRDMVERLGDRLEEHISEELRKCLESG